MCGLLNKLSLNSDTIYIIIRLTHANVWDSMGKPCSWMQFSEKPYFVLQVTRESVLGTTSHMRCVWTCNEIKGSHDKIIISIVPSHNITAVGVVTRAAHLWRTCNYSKNKTVISTNQVLSEFQVSEHITAQTVTLVNRLVKNPDWLCVHHFVIQMSK